MSREQTDIVIRVLSKWDYDLIAKWLQLKKGPEAVAEAMGKIGDKGKKAGGIMGTITKGWDNDFKNIVRGLTGVGLAFRALDGIISVLRSSVGTYVQQTQSAQASAQEQMTRTGATLGPMLWMADERRVKEEFGMDQTQFTAWLQTRSFGGLQPTEINTTLMRVFSEMQEVTMREALNGLEAIMRMQPQMQGDQAAALMLSANPLYTKGGAFEGDLPGSLAFLMAGIRKSVVSDLPQFAEATAAYVKYVSKMGTPEGIAERQAELDKEFGPGVKDAKIESMARAYTVLIGAQNLATDLNTRQTAHGALAAAISIPQMYQELALSGEYSPEERARAMQLRERPFANWWEEISSGDSKLAKDTKAIWDLMGALSVMELKTNDPNATLRDEQELAVLSVFGDAGTVQDAFSGIAEKMSDMADRSPTLAKYWEKAEAASAQYEEVMESIVNAKVAPGERGELKSRITVQQMMFDKNATGAQSIYDALPKSRAEAEPIWDAMSGALTTEQGAVSALDYKVKATKAWLESQRTADAAIKIMTDVRLHFAEQNRSIVDHYIARIQQILSSKSENAPEAIAEVMEEFSDYLGDEATKTSDPPRRAMSHFDQWMYGKPKRRFYGVKDGRRVSDSENWQIMQAQQLKEKGLWRTLHEGDAPFRPPSAYSTSEPSRDDLLTAEALRRQAAHFSEFGQQLRNIHAELQKLNSFERERLFERANTKDINLIGPTGARIPAKTKVPTITTPNDSDLVP